MRCKYCGCSTNEDVIEAAFWTDKELFVIKDVPARSCEGCGEQFFEEETTQRIRQLTPYPVAKAKQQIRVAIHSLAQPMADRTKCHAMPNRAKQDHQPAFLCKCCGSKTTEELVDSAFWVDGALLAVENIPARVCPQCGEQFYDAGIAEKINTLGKHGLVPGASRREALVPVFSLADVEES